MTKASTLQFDGSTDAQSKSGPKFLVSTSGRELQLGERVGVVVSKTRGVANRRNLSKKLCGIVP